jgi:thiol-disulfide isomerase/thioredoxin
MIRAFSAISFFLILALFFASQGEQQKDVPQEKQSSLISPKVNLLTIDSLENLLKVRNGKVLFLNVWATWCIPCREEFPDIVKLFRKYKKDKIDFVGISADFPDEIESKVIPFLQDQKVDFPIYVQNFEHQEDLINRLNPEWSGALPATLLYNDRGELIKFMLGKQSYQQFKEVIDTLLKSS